MDETPPGRRCNLPGGLLSVHGTWWNLSQGGRGHFEVYYIDVGRRFDFRVFSETLCRCVDSMRTEGLGVFDTLCYIRTNKFGYLKPY